MVQTGEVTIVILGGRESIAIRSFTFVWIKKRRKYTIADEILSQHQKGHQRLFEGHIVRKSFIK